MRSASSAASLRRRLSMTRTSPRATRAISPTAASTSSKWCAATRQATTSKLASVKGKSSARQRTSGRMPGAGSQLTTSSPASRNRRATWPRGLGQHRPAFLGVRPVEADDDRQLDRHPLERLEDAACDLVAAGDPAEDVEQDAVYLRIRRDHL